MSSAEPQAVAEMGTCWGDCGFVLLKSQHPLLYCFLGQDLLDSAGTLNYSNHMGVAALKEKICQLRQRIQKVSNYAQGNDCVSVSVCRPILHVSTFILPLRLNFFSYNAL